MTVEKCAEWTAGFDGTLEELAKAVAEIRDAGAPGTSEVTVKSGMRGLVTARFYYGGDESEEEVDDPVPTAGATL